VGGGLQGSSLKAHSRPWSARARPTPQGLNSTFDGMASGARITRGVSPSLAYSPERSQPLAATGGRRQSGSHQRPKSAGASRGRNTGGFNGNSGAAAARDVSGAGQARPWSAGRTRGTPADAAASRSGRAAAAAAGPFDDPAAVSFEKGARALEELFEWQQTTRLLWGRLGELEDQEAIANGAGGIVGGGHARRVDHQPPKLSAESSAEPESPLERTLLRNASPDGLATEGPALSAEELLELRTLRVTDKERGKQMSSLKRVLATQV